MFTIYDCFQSVGLKPPTVKCTITFIFTNTRKSCGNFPLFSQIYIATLKRITHPRMHEERKADKAYCCWSDQLTHLNYSFLYTFSHKVLICLLYICKICNVIVDCWTHHHQTSTPVFFNHCLQIPQPSYCSEQNPYAATTFKITLHFKRKKLSRAWNEGKPD